MSAALLLALSLPALVTAATAIHEAAHHRHDDATGDYLVAVVHGHHHDREIEEHDHEAVTTKIRGGSMAERSAVPRVPSEWCVDTTLGRVCQAPSHPLLEAPHSSDLCIWQL